MTVFHRVKLTVGLSLAWMVIWATIGATLAIVIGIIDPASIDPGEGPIDLARIIGGLGAMCGGLFGLLLVLGERRRTLGEISFLRAVLWGILAGVAPPLLTPMNDALAATAGPFGALSAATCVAFGRALRRPEPAVHT